MEVMKDSMMALTVENRRWPDWGDANLPKSSVQRVQNLNHGQKASQSNSIARPLATICSMLPRAEDQNPRYS